MIDPNEVPWKVLLSEKLWALRGDAAIFQAEVRKILERCHPGFIPQKAKYPYVLCLVDRELRRRRLAEEAVKWEKK